MTDAEMRRRLAEAMGWTDIRPPAERVLGADWVGIPPKGCIREIPDPLEDDRDASLLRAWVVEPEQDGLVQLDCDADDTEVLVWLDSGYAVATVTRTEEPDPCRRERLALCRAVVQALEVQPWRG